MTIKTNPFLLLSIMVFTLIFSVSEVVAQCSGGGRRGMPTGSTGTINPALLSRSSTSTNSMAMSLMRQRSQSPSMQNRAMALAYQNAMRQRVARSAYEERVRPTRLARAEATRAARAARVAARLAERDGLPDESSSQYMFTSARIK